MSFNSINDIINVLITQVQETNYCIFRQTELQVNIVLPIYFLLK